jgi:hypothetical protein
MAAQIPLIVPNGYYDKLGATTIRTPIALERMLNGPILKVNNPLWPMTNPPNKSANEADATGGRPLSTGASPMPDFNQPMGGMPAGYGSLLNSAQQQLVRMPDGTYAVSPRAVSPQGMYDGTYPASSPPPGVSRVTPEGLNVYSRPTVAIGPDGNPVTAPRGFGPSGVGNSWSSVASAPPVNSPRGGMLPFPPDTPPPRNYTGLGGGPWQSMASAPPVQTSSPRQQTLLAGMFGRGQGGYWSGALKDQAQLPSNDGGEAGFLQAFGPGASPNPALDAIDVTINGGRRMPPMPRMRPAFAGIAPQGAGSPPQVPGAITFKKGDTVSKLAKQRGMTVSSFADLFGIANPNKIRAGQTVFRQAPPVPMPGRPMALSRGPVPPIPRTPSPMQRTPASVGETFDSVWAEARG